MKKQDAAKYDFIPHFETKEVAGVEFGGFGLDRHMMASGGKIPLRGKTLPEAMILCADKEKGRHLLTAFQWAALAYKWKSAKTLDDLDCDLHAETWQWIMGLFMEPNGSVDVLGSLDVTYKGSPYGRGTINCAKGKPPTLQCDGKGKNWLKKWSAGAFDGMKLYIAEAGDNGGFIPIVGTSMNGLLLSAGGEIKNGTATFCIVRHIDTDVTRGIDSGSRITSLRYSDRDLKAFAIPATSNDHGTPDLGNDRFWFYKGISSRAAFRGGDFGNGADAGVFALALHYAPSHSTCYIGFRAAKAL